MQQSPNVRLSGRVGGAQPGRKALTLVHAIVAGGSHIDHADMLRAGAIGSVLSHRVMAPSTLGTFLRSFTFGHIRQLDRVMAESLRRAWAFGAGPGGSRLVIDVDSTVCVDRGLVTRRPIGLRVRGRCPESLGSAGCGPAFGTHCRLPRRT